jgi:hypothetical protein
VGTLNLADGVPGQPGGLHDAALHRAGERPASWPASAAATMGSCTSSPSRTSRATNVPVASF